MVALYADHVAAFVDLSIINISGGWFATPVRSQVATGQLSKAESHGLIGPTFLRA